MNKYAIPTMSFPHKISHRLAIMAIPRKQIFDTGDGMPKLSPTGVRISALRGRASERTNECAWPYVKRLIALKMMYKDKFSKDRLEKLDRSIAAANSTAYSKLSGSTVVLRKGGVEDKKVSKKKGWTESDWRKHMEYISQISHPKPLIKPEPIDRGPRKPLEEFNRLEMLSYVPPTKMYKRVSQQSWYRNPQKVAPLALKYVISERVKKLAEPKTLKTE